MVKAVVLDSNALMMPFQFKINLDMELRRLFGDLPVCVPSSVIGELERVLDKNARAAAALAGRYKVVPTDLSGDDAVIELAARMGAAVVTNDKELIRRLRAEGIRVVRMRGKHHLECDED